MGQMEYLKFLSETDGTHYAGSQDNPYPVSAVSTLRTIQMLNDDGGVEMTISGLVYDLDLWNISFAGYMSLAMETVANNDGTGLDAVAITVEPLLRNYDDDDWITLVNTTALTLEDDADIADVGEGAAWSVTKCFEDNGDTNKFMMAEGLRFSFSEGANAHGTFVGKFIIR